MEFILIFVIFVISVLAMIGVACKYFCLSVLLELFLNATNVHFRGIFCWFGWFSRFRLLPSSKGSCSWLFVAVFFKSVLGLIRVCLFVKAMLIMLLHYGRSL